MSLRHTAILLFAALVPAASARADEPADSDALPAAGLPRDLVVVHDGRGHYLATSLTDRDQVFYGDGKTLWQQAVISSGASPGDGNYSWRLWAPMSPQHADVALQGNKAWTIECSGRTIPVQPLDEKETRALIDGARFKKGLWKRQSVALARDRGGRYFFVDRLRDEHGGKGLRMFIGKKGALKEQTLSDAVDDSAGLLLTSKAGALHLDLAAGTAKFGKGKKTAPLVFLPVQDNRLLIYGDLGVYRQRLGVPCDDL